MIRTSRDVIAKRLEARNISIIGEYTGIHKKSPMRCNCGYSWTARVDNVIRRGCPSCNTKIKGGHHLYSKLTKETVNNRIKSRGICVIGDYTNIDTKTEFQCKYGHCWSAAPASVLKISGCPHCANYSYKNSLPGWVYVLKFDSFIKFGITNNLNSRLRRHTLHNGKYELIISKLYQTGKEARIIENTIKTLYKGGYVTKDQCPDGYTETLPLSAVVDVFQIINGDAP